MDKYTVTDDEAIIEDDNGDLLYIGDVADLLRLVLSEHGRTVEQSIDDVPLEEWEIEARAIIKQSQVTCEFVGY